MKFLTEIFKILSSFKLFLIFFLVGNSVVHAQNNGQVASPGAVRTGLPIQNLVAQPIAQPVEIPEAPMKLEGGATLSGDIPARSRLIENDRPERAMVFPEDPDSAWWEINPSYAFARAQREQKPLLLLFTGIWNTQAMGLSQEVFATKSFNEYVKENLVICYLKYPKSITDAPPALRRIKEKFKVRGYPNVLLFNPNGEVHRGLRGYRTGKPVTYFNKLKVACRPVLESIILQKESLGKRGYRDWSNFLGKVIFAKFVRRDDRYAALVDVSGNQWFIPINDLGPDDQRLVESFPESEKIVISDKK